MTASIRFTAAASATVAILVGCGESGPTDARQFDPSTVPSLQTSHFGAWSAPVSLGPAINTPALENAPMLSRDGLTLYFASNRTGGQGSVDIYVSRRACTDFDDPQCAWGTPENLGPTVNSPKLDGGPELSHNEHMLYLFSDRDGGFGSNDIYVSRRDESATGGWSPPENLGAPINTAALEAGANTLGSAFYFHRGPVSTNTDIFLSRMIGDSFTDPVLVAELSVPGTTEQRPSPRQDGREMVFSSDRAGGVGGPDVWVSTRPGRGRPWTTPVNLGPTVNSEFQESTPSISGDGRVLLFASNRGGNVDIYVSTRTTHPQE